jgi:hypothetical protein
LDPSANLLAYAPWDVDDERLYFVYKSVLCVLDRKTGKIERKVIPVLDGYVKYVRVFGDKLFALYDSAVVMVDLKTYQGELLASAQRRPAQTPLDDRKPFLPPVLFADQEGIIFLVDDMLYLLDPATRAFRVLPQKVLAAPGGNYDPVMTLKSIAASPDDEWRTGSQYMLFLCDPGRSGAIPRMRGVWPTGLKLEGREKGGSQVLSSTVLGQTLYIFFSGGDELGNFVKIMGPENHVVPLPGSNPQKNMRFDRILASEEGILIWNRAAPELLFYKTEDLLRP